jgi:hypothetical protein
MKAVFVFCEGAHDVHFLSRVLAACKDYVTVDKAVHFPAPLDTFLAMRFASEQRRLETTSFAKLARISLPRLEAVLKSPDDSRLALLFACEGDGQSSKILDLLKDFQKVFNAPLGSSPVAGSTPKKRVDSWSTLVCYDADDAGVDSRIDKMRKEYAGWFGDLSGLEEAKWFPTQKVPLALVLFRSSSDGLGTLEDILTPMMRKKQAQGMAASEGFIANTMWEGCVLKGSGDPPAQAILTKRKKAALTALAQFDHPSYSLAVFIANTKLLTAETIQADPFCRRIAALISE